MKLLPFKPVVSVDNTGSVILHYGATGVGKSASDFASLPGVIIYLCMERRDAKRSAVAVNRDPKDYRIGVFTDFRELMEFLQSFEEQIKTAWDLTLDDIGSVVLDGLEQLMLNISTEMEEQIHDVQDDKDRKSLIAETKLTKEAYGALPKQMARAINVLCKLAQEHGKIIVMNTLMEEQRNEWDDTYTAEPKFEGRKFGTMYAGWCDLIGLVERRYKETTVKIKGKDTVVNRLVFPPMVKYEKEKWENFTCKWTGKRLVNKNNPEALIQLPLDFNVILELNKQGKETEKKTEKNVTPEKAQPEQTKTKEVEIKKEPKPKVAEKDVTKEKPEIQKWI